jgi:hypothetical protein
VRALEIAVVERNNLEGALRAFRAMDKGEDALKKLAMQTDRASRFTFVVPDQASDPAATAQPGPSGS